MEDIGHRFQGVRECPGQAVRFLAARRDQIHQNADGAADQDIGSTGRQQPADVDGMCADATVNAVAVMKMAASA